MTSPAKVKGSKWERDAAEILTKLIPGSVWKRIPSSGAIGTIMSEPILGADIKGRVPGISREFRGEAKVGYGGAEYLRLKREWLLKIREEANKLYAIPFLIGKFSGARGESKEFIVLDLDAFALLINIIGDLDRELQDLNLDAEQYLGNNKSS